MPQNKSLFFFLPIFLSVFVFNFSINQTLALSANITKLVFTTDAQSIGVNEISGTISVQTQNLSGSSENLDETSDLYLFSSLVGEFSSNSTNWNPVDKITMSNGSANRNFYFRSSIAGRNMITARLVGRVTSKEWSVSQDINIGVISSTSSDSENNSPTSTSDSASDNLNQNNQTVKVITENIYVSTHSSEEDLSDYNQKTPFEISAGRERTASIGSSLGFDAKYTLLQKDQCVPNFKWSFGDGLETSGKNTSHSYKFPGEYQVVLNGSCGEFNSVSRTTVKVIAPIVSISILPKGDVAINNNDKAEINIGGWKITGGQKVFIFSQDTIISGSNKIILSNQDLGTDASTSMVAIDNPSGGEVASTDIKNIAEDTSVALQIAPSQSTSTSISTMSLNKSGVSVKTVAKVQVINTLPSQNDKQNISNLEAEVTNNLDQIATLAVADSVSDKGFWSKLISIPVKSVESFVRMFYNF